MATEVRVDVIRKHDDYMSEFRNIEFQTKRYIDRLGVFFVGQIQRGMRNTPRDIETRRSIRGNPPAIDTGRLVSSIRYQPIGYLTGKVFTNVEYAVYLERDLDRKFMSPTTMAYKNTELLAQATAKEITK